MSTPITSHRDLIAWQKAMDFVVATYKLTDKFPKHERYALGDQLRRAAVSVAANLAEGHGRSTRPDYRHFVGLALASLMEADTEIQVAQRVGHVTPEDCAEAVALAQETGRLVNGFRRSLA